MPEPPSQSSTPGGQPPDSGPRQGRIRLSNHPDDIEAIRGHLLESIESSGYPEAAAFAIRLAFDEAIANAFKHGHRGLPAHVPVHVAIDVSTSQVRITVEDSGPGFDPEEVPDPTLDENLSRPSGRGIMLMRAYMTDVTFNERGNEVTLIYDRPGEAESP